MPLFYPFLCLWCYLSSQAFLPTATAHSDRPPVCPCVRMFSLHSSLQIAPLLANESLEGCTLQLLSSDAITASVPSKSWVKPLP